MAVRFDVVVSSEDEDEEPVLRPSHATMAHMANGKSRHSIFSRRSPGERLMAMLRCKIVAAKASARDISSENIEDIKAELADSFEAMEEDLARLQQEVKSKDPSHAMRLMEKFPEEDEATTEIRRDMARTYSDYPWESAQAHDMIAKSSRRTRCRSSTMKRSVFQRGDSMNEDLDARVASVFASTSVLESLEDGGEFDFDAVNFCNQPEVVGMPITVLGAFLVNENNITSGLVDEGYVGTEVDFDAAFLAFCGHLDKLYRSHVIYHGRAHACDVMSTTVWAMKSELFNPSWISSLERFMCLAAAAIHDVGHPGVNNLFMEKARMMTVDSLKVPSLALRYNDKGILENYHVALAFETMLQDPESNWFGMLLRDFKRDEADEASVDVQSFVRQGLIHMVLHTDMKMHANFQAELVQFSKDHEEVIRKATASLECHDHSEGDTEPVAMVENFQDKFLILGSMLHAVDISNPVRPRPIMKKWCKAFLEESFAQGDLEQELGLVVSPFCDRKYRATVPEGQLGFINFVIEPYWRALRVVLPETDKACDQLAENKAYWLRMKESAVTWEELFEHPSIDTDDDDSDP